MKRNTRKTSRSKSSGKGLATLVWKKCSIGLPMMAGPSDSDDSVGEGGGIYAYLGKPETDNRELNLLASLVDNEVEPPSASGGLDIEHSICLDRPICFAL